MLVLFVGPAQHGRKLSPQHLNPDPGGKCWFRLQAVRYKSTTECLLVTLREGGPRAIYHGHVGTLCREVPGNMAWFGGYELGLYMQIPKGGSRSDVNPLGLMAAGDTIHPKP